MRSTVDFTEDDREDVVKYWLDNSQHYSYAPQSRLSVNQFYQISEVVTEDSALKLVSPA